MQLLEFDKKEGLFGRSYALGITLAPETNNQFEREMGDLPGAIGEWVARRGSSAKHIQLTFVGLDPMLDAFESRLALLLGADLGKSLGKRPIVVSALHPDGTLVREGTIGGCQPPIS